MAFPINDLMVSQGPKVFYDPAFRRVIESHLRYFRRHPDAYTLNVDPYDVYKHEGDLNGLLRKMGIPQHYHWIVMRVNDLTNVNQVDATLTTLLIPPNEEVERLKQRFLTTVKKTSA